MTQNNMEVVAGKWLLMKRGLYWMPNSQGYTGLKSEAGRYTDEEVAIYRRQDEREVFVLEAETADEIAPKCWPDVAQRHLQGLLTSAQAEIERLAKERDEARAEIERMTPNFVAYDYLESPAGRELAEARAEAAEKERDALREVLKPFAEAANSIENDSHDDWPMWEHPACTDVYVRDFRRASSALQPLEQKND